MKFFIRIMHQKIHLLKIVVILQLLSMRYNKLVELLSTFRLSLGIFFFIFFMIMTIHGVIMSICKENVVIINEKKNALHFLHNKLPNQ